ncbi:MAG TPA: hypothetical protein VIP11_06220 [Gemmatimonadaceae bacterium]
MWADTLFRAEQQHLLRLLLWSGLSIVAATLVAVTMTIRRLRSPLLRQFALQMALWGVVLALIGAIRWRTVEMRDLAAAARLERLLWMNVGLDVGYVAAGAALAATAWVLARRAGPVGAGVGIIVQGIALLVLDLQFAAVVSR